MLHHQLMVTNLRCVMHFQELSGCKAVDRFALSWCAKYHVKTLHRGDAAARVEQCAFDAYQAMPASLGLCQPIPGRCRDALPPSDKPKSEFGSCQVFLCTLGFLCQERAYTLFGKDDKDAQGNLTVEDKVNSTVNSNYDCWNVFERSPLW